MDPRQMSPSTDPHVLGPGLLPTPYTSEEIRAARSSGTTVRMLVEPARATGESAYVRVSRFADCTPEGATYETWRETLELEVVGDVARRPLTWLDLQRHAAFPIEATMIGHETITTPLGDLACRRYAVTDGAETTTFWFDLSRPGMPVRIVEDVDGRVVETTTMIADDRV